MMSLGFVQNGFRILNGDDTTDIHQAVTDFRSKSNGHVMTEVLQTLSRKES